MSTEANLFKYAKRTALFVIGSIGLGQSAVAQSYTVTELTGLGMVSGQISAINNVGTVVGTGIVNGYNTPFAFSNGARTYLGLLPQSIGESASVINNTGTIAGTSSDPIGNYYVTELITFKNGALTNLGTLPGAGMNVYSIND